MLKNFMMMMMMMITFFFLRSAELRLYSRQIGNIQIISTEVTVRPIAHKVTVRPIAHNTVLMV